MTTTSFSTLSLRDASDTRILLEAVVAVRFRQMIGRMRTLRFVLIAAFNILTIDAVRVVAVQGVIASLIVRRKFRINTRRIRFCMHMRRKAEQLCHTQQQRKQALQLPISHDVAFFPKYLCYGMIYKNQYIIRLQPP